MKVLMIVPTLSYSHISFNAKVAETLVSKGHEVVTLLPDVDDRVPSPNGNYEIIRRDVGLASGELSKTLWTNPDPYEDSSPLNPRIFLKLLRVSSLFVKACKALANDRLLLESLRERQFDVGMLEQYDSCGFGIFRAIGVNNIVWLSATGAYAEQPQTIGVNYPLSYVPNLFAPLGDEMGFLDSLQNVLVSTVTGAIYSYTRAQQSQIFWKTGVLAFGEDLLATARKSDAVVVNTLPFLDFAMPTSQQIAYIGGLTVQKQERSLNTVDQEFWRQIADSSTKGFVLVTFGSIARTVDMPLDMQRKFFTACSRFPEITFIVKYEAANSTLPIPLNVQLTPWIPQAELMGGLSIMQTFLQFYW
ncbi:UDP-glucoronosyl and UDP-glucosyl transferase [Oesophagostomum dentatum]|uniref:glucuronosyltransferase n=1 Tax=Oesophagostomum dentatum TaxID=61180 RepID=A0A0B1T9L0_OESDE|nr:UDP-glucoronosyl and UDP-glucosyl transferase [Oesophagostomum dentatum]